MLLLLLAGGAIYLALGRSRRGAAAARLRVLSIVITIVQEARTERVLEVAARPDQSARAGHPRRRAQRIAGRDVVRGDLIVLSEGDRVAADATVRPRRRSACR